MFLRLAFFVFGITLAAACAADAQEEPRIEIVPESRPWSRVWSVAFSPDGKTALSGSQDSTLRLWDLAGGREIRTFLGHSGGVVSVAIAPDSKTALSGGLDKTLRLWDLANGRELKKFEGHSDRITSVAIAPDGKIALSGSADKTLRLWDLASGREIRKFDGHSAWVTSVAIAPDGKTALSAGCDFANGRCVRGSLRLWDLAGGAEIKKFEGYPLFTSVAIAPDTKTALSKVCDDEYGEEFGTCTLRLWDLASGREIKKFEGRSGPVAFAPDGKTALSGGGDNTLSLWDLASGREIKKFVGHSDAVTSVAFSPDGETVLSGSADRTLRLWDLASGREIKRFEGYSRHAGPVAIAPDGKTALSGGGDKTLRLWDLASGREIKRFEGRSGPIAFSPDGKTVLFGACDEHDAGATWNCVRGSLRLWDLASGVEIKRFEGHSAQVSSIVVSPDGKTALSGSYDKTLRLWDLASGREIKTFEGHSFWVSSVAFSQDGKTALSGSIDKTLRVWDLASGREIKKFVGHSSGVTSVAIAPDGRTALSGSHDKTLRLWDLDSGVVIKAFEGHSKSVSSVAIAPDGKTALSGSEDKTVRLWDLASGREIKTFEGHSESVYFVAFALDGKAALSGSSDGTVRLWDLRRGELLVTLLTSRDGDQLTITPAGFYAASGKDVDKMLHVVRGFETYSILEFYEHLNRPDLVAERLMGDPDSKYHNAAYQLSLDKILQSGKAPKLERLDNRESVEGGKLRLAVRLTDQGGGIGEKVIWRVNGTVQGKTTALGPSGPVRTGRDAVLEQELQVDSTIKSEIEVVAYNGKGLLATEPLRMSFDPVQGRVQEWTAQARVAPASAWAENSQSVAGCSLQVKPEFTSLSEVSPYFIDALIAAEDPNFYTHTPEQAPRFYAAYKSAQELAKIKISAIRLYELYKFAQGVTDIPNNISQEEERALEIIAEAKKNPMPPTSNKDVIGFQLARCVNSRYGFSDEREFSLLIRIERDFRKCTILELYVNQTYLGRHLYGVSAASQAYFGKRIKDLTLSEAAFLAGLFKNPAEFSSSSKGLKRRNEVLDIMVQTGKITSAQAEAAKTEPLDLKPNL
jgi:WD40 repeat protein